MFFHNAEKSFSKSVKTILDKIVIFFTLRLTEVKKC